MTGAKQLRIAVIGAGPSGLMAFIKLRKAGFDDVTIFEKAGDLGGTWRDNKYPGLTCDVPSLIYCYSFAPNAEWSATYSAGGEIYAYLKSVAKKFNVEPFIKYDSEVIRAYYIDRRWHLETTQGKQGAFDTVITAAGWLHHPVKPDIPGLGDFQGTQLHSSHWDSNIAVDGKRIGIIGCGSTGTQLVSALASKTKKLSLFQRTAQWIMPSINEAVPEERKAEFRANPELLKSEFDRLNNEHNTLFAAAVVGEEPRAYAGIVKACKKHLESVADPELRAKLTPDYEVGCKRLVVSGTFYQAIQKDNVELVTESIDRIEAKGVRTADGRLHELDILVLATGFDAHKYFRPTKVTGLNGVTIDDAWAEGTRNYLSVTIPGFPNWFMIGGPNSPVGNFPWFQTAEHQFDYAFKLIELLQSGAASQIAPKASASQKFHDAIQENMPKTVWASGCKSWYMDKNGNIDSWPWTYEKFQKDMAEPVLSDFEMS